MPHRPHVVCALAVLLAASSALVPAAHGKAAPREIVIAHEYLAEAGEHLAGNVDALVARIEEVAGFPKGTFRGRGFSKPNEALAYIRKNKVPFAILPAHQYVEARKALKLEVLGRAVGLDREILQFTAVTRRPKPFGDLPSASNLKVATTEASDPMWLAVLTEGDVDPRRRAFQMLEVGTSKEALEALLAKKVDLAILHPRLWPEIKHRADAGGDLEWVVTSPKLPPSAFVAVGTYVRAAEKKKLAAAVDKICKTTGAPACGRMDILYVEAGRGETYQDLIDGYEARRF